MERLKRCDKEFPEKTHYSTEIKQSANKIVANHLRDQNSLPEITDAVYAITRAVNIKLEIKRPLRKEKKAKENRGVRQMKKQMKELTQPVPRAGNETYQRKHWGKVLRKEKRIIEELKRKVNSNLNKLKDIMIAKKI